MGKLCGCEPQHSYYCANCYEHLQAKNAKLNESLKLADEIINDLVEVASVHLDDTFEKINRLRKLEDK